MKQNTTNSASAQSSEQSTGSTSSSAISKIEATFDRFLDDFASTGQQNKNSAASPVSADLVDSLDILQPYLPYLQRELPCFIAKESATGDAWFFVLQNYVYVAQDVKVINSIILKYLDKHGIPHRKNADFTKQLLSTDKFVNINQLNADTKYINTQGCLLNIETMEEEHFNPSILSTIQLPVIWAPYLEFPSPNFDAFLDRLTDGDKDKAQFLLEYMGATFSNVPGYKFKKALFLYGPNNTGRIQLMRLMQDILQGYCASLDLHQMRWLFGSERLFETRFAGIMNMMPMTKADLAYFKNLVDGDGIVTILRKKQHLQFRFKGFLWFGMDTLNLPEDGLDRIIAVECKNPEPDADILDKIKMKDEWHGIFEKAIKAFKGVIDNGYKFHEPEDRRLASAITGLAIERGDFDTTGDPVEFFRTMMMRRNPHDYLRNDKSTVNRIYASYQTWCTGQDKHYLAKKDFFNAIAVSLGQSYEDMKARVHVGDVLREYRLITPPEK